MVKRTVLGLVKGLLIGGLVALLLIEGLGVVTFGTVLAYAFALLTGVLAGLLAGKPIWARGARVEAGLKAIAGALLAVGMMFALRRWVVYSLDLTALGIGSGVIGQLPAISLPVIATVLAVVFELDNTPGGEDLDTARRAKAPRRRVPEHPPSAGADAGLEVSDAEQPGSSERSRHLQ
jgi:hypothetical protein